MGRHRKSRSPSLERQQSSSYSRRDRDKDDDRNRERSKSSSGKSRDDKSRKKSEERSHRHKSRNKSRSPKRSKDKRRSKRDPSSSSDSSDSARKEVVLDKNFLEKLEAERMRAIEEKKKWKEQMKALETPEEKRKRRLMKKEAKERKEKEQMGWDNELLHYTNNDNPFGDSNLLEKFVWRKKLEKEGKADMSQDQIERELRMKQMANRDELEKVKARRQEREAEKAAREDETAEMQRAKEADQFKEWQKHEDQFHLEQAKLRSAIRIQDGRAKPVDVLAKYINSENDPDAVEMNEPYFYLMGLTLADLEDLVADIKIYMELETESSNLDYWNDLMVIVEDEVRAMRKLERAQKSDYEAAMGRQEGINAAVAKDVTDIFKNKTAAALVTLKSNIEKKISTRQEGVDISYWESLLSQLKAHIARARLRDRHGANLKRKLEILKAQQGLVDAAATASGESSAIKTEPEEPEENDDALRPPGEEEEAEQGDEDDEAEGDQAQNDMIEPYLAAYDSGRYSPIYLQSSDLEPTQLVYTEEDDFERIEFARARVQGRPVATTLDNADAYTLEERALRGEAQKGMSADEAIFSVESTIDKPVYLWSDKYRPRKPRYFNRVHTGFEWNKYNQTHYDMDNPPPKIVQGYKFNIFYPDLIDKNATPQYTITPCPDNRDFGILRFRAGPPYEDIAFKIVNREWEYSYKKGFRCQFHNNIMQLWFHFKRYRYRR